jgi:hypothetical protein
MITTRQQKLYDVARDHRVALVEAHGELLKTLPRFRNFTRQDQNMLGPLPQPGNWHPSHRDALVLRRSSADFAA